MSSRHNLGLLFGFIGMCLFAGTLPATRVAISGFDPWFLTIARATLAGVAGLIVLALSRRRMPPRSIWLELFAAGLCTVVGYPLFAALAMLTVPAAHGGVVLGVLPLVTAAAATVLAHERPSLGFWLASALGAALVVAFMIHRNSGGIISAGDLFLLGAVASGALGYTFSGRLSALMPGWEVISWQVVIFLPVATLATLTLWPAEIATAPLSACLGLGYIGLVSQYLAFFVFNAALALSGIARVGQIMLLQPFVIVALAVPINGERFDLETIAFAAAVVATVLISQRMRVIRR